MTKKITAYQAIDGKLFNDRVEAEKWDHDFCVPTPNGTWYDAWRRDIKKQIANQSAATRANLSGRFKVG